MKRVMPVVVAAGFLALAACEADDSPTAPTAPDTDGYSTSAAEPCDVEADLRPYTRSGQGINPDRAEWNARLSCVGGTPGRPGRPGRVKIRFGAELVVNGVALDWDQAVVRLESGESRWLCGSAYAAEPTAWCNWHGTNDYDLLDPGDAWTLKGYWKWCLVDDDVVGDPCPDDPFD